MSKAYIEKEAAINYLTLNMCWYDEEGGQVDDWDERKAIISDLLDGIPPADVKPVVRGEWVEEPVSGWPYCSKCGYGALFSDIYETPIRTNFCPNCGAEMREEANDER